MSSVVFFDGLGAFLERCVFVSADPVLPVSAALRAAPALAARGAQRAGLRLEWSEE
jgi:hypothetical protein